MAVRCRSRAAVKGKESAFHPVAPPFRALPASGRARAVVEGAARQSGTAQGAARRDDADYDREVFRELLEQYQA